MDRNLRPPSRAGETAAFLAVYIVGALLVAVPALAVAWHAAQALTELTP